MSLFREFSHLLTSRFPQGQAFLVGLSGGMDSIVLLTLLHQFCQQHLNFHLRAIHIHHGISPNADDWLQFCQKFCENRGISFLAKKVSLNFAENLESEARTARYQAVAEEITEQEIFITAHHQDDQVETFFLALKRGSGLKGLSAMARFSRLGNTPLFRPLLGFSRQRLHQFAIEQKLQWVEDESNQDLHYDRNFLRHQGLKDLRSRWLHFDEAVCRSALLCEEQQQLIEELLCHEFQQNFDDFRGTLNIAAFANWSNAKQNALLRMWLAQHHQLMPSQKQLQQIKKDVIFAKKDSSPHFQLNQKIIRRYQSFLFLTDLFADLKNIELDLFPNQTIRLPDNLGTLFLDEKGVIHWHKIKEERKATLPPMTAIRIKFSYTGKIKQPNGRHESLKKCWQNAGVPPWERGRIPLIFVENTFICALGYF